jgi:oligopeptide transport system substrate-binding protein
LKKSYEEHDLVIRSNMLEDAEALLARDQPAATVMTNAALWLVSTKVKGFADNSVNQHLTRFLSLQ